MPARWLGAHADAFVGVALILFAAIFWRESGKITVYPNDPGLGATGLPVALCAFIAIAGAVLVLMGTRRPSSTTDGAATSLGIRRFCIWVLPLAALSFVYVEAVEAMQYLLPTIVATAVVLWMFNNRGVVWLVIAPIIAACLFYGIFFVGLRLYEPPGYWLNPF
ncbi:MAG: tripartite tricarboxylate transporter TctB family protein [Pseudomonadota bacterium]